MKKTPFLFLFLFIVFTIHAQEFATRLYTPQHDGLINTQVNCVKQAPDGRIWVGTQGGISCFDGLEFKNYTEEDGLSANLINDLYPLRDTVFVLTRDGIDLIINGKIINYFSDEKIKFVTGKIKINKDYQYVIAYDYNKSFLFNVRKKTQWFFPENIQSTGRVIASLTDSSVLIGKGNVLFEITFDDSNSVPVFEFTTRIGRIGVFDDYIFVNCVHPDYHKGNKTITYKLFKNGKTFSKTQFEINKELKLDENELIDRWFYSKEGKTFLFTNTGKLVYHNKGKAIKYVRNYNNINGATEDQNGNLWMATEKGLLKVFMDKFQYYTHEQGYPENVWTAAGINDSLVLMASYNNRIHVYKNGEHKDINDSDAYYQSCYLGACFGFQNDLLVCTYPGIAKYDITNNKLSIIDDKMSDPSLTLYKDELNKRVLVGNLRTLVSLNEDYSTDSLFDITTLGNFYTIISIAVRNNKILLGLTKGLLEFDHETGSAHYLINEKIRFNSILVDDKNTIWAATSKGLMHILHDSSYFIQGIENPKSLRSLILSNNGKIFAAGQTNLYTINLKKYYNEKQNYLKSYGLYDGYLGNGPQQNTFFKDTDGNIWLPTSTKVIKIFPDELESDDHMFNTEIVNISISNGDTVYTSLNMNEKLAFPYSQNCVRLSFVAVNQINPELTEYLYVLENNTKNWSSIQKERKASFINLPAGNYKFTVKASTEKSFENSPESIIYFTILPPFWQRWWFAAVLFLSSVGFIILIIRLVKRKEQKKNNIKMELFGLKNVALSIQIDHHFLANCISKIVILNESGKLEEANKYTKNFVNFLKTHLVFLRSEKISLEDELQLIKQYVYLEKLYGKDFQFDLNIDKTIDTKKVFIYHFLIQPIIENAIRHGAKQLKEGLGKVRLKVKMQNGKIKISIEDNGPGIQNNTFTKKEGNNISLVIVQERLKLMGKDSKYYFDSKNTGTKVTIEVPIK